MNEIYLAIIGGTGAFKKNNKRNHIEINTDYGEVIVEVVTINGKDVALLKRHGASHSIPPHKINYRANIMALKKLGVRKILATAAVGSLTKEFKPGDLVLVNDFIDFTHGRESTFFDGEKQGVVHVDMTNPYCKNLRENLRQAALDCSISLHEKEAIYVCTQGPRFETPAEISMYKQLGAHVVGMTSVPEVVLAREAEICYATVSIITNFAAGVSSTNLTHQEVLERMDESAQKLEKLFNKAVEIIDHQDNCWCHEAVSSQQKLGG